MNLFGIGNKSAHLDNVAHRLPSYQEIIELMQKVDGSEYYLHTLYPLVAKHSGEDVTPSMLVDIIKNAITEFCATKPMGRALEVLLMQKVHSFASVLIDDLFFQEGLKKLFTDE